LRSICRAVTGREPTKLAQPPDATSAAARMVGQLSNCSATNLAAVAHSQAMMTACSSSNWVRRNLRATVLLTSRTIVARSSTTISGCFGSSTDRACFTPSAKATVSLSSARRGCRQDSFGPSRAAPWRLRQKQLNVSKRLAGNWRWKSFGMASEVATYL